MSIKVSKTSRGNELEIVEPCKADCYVDIHVLRNHHMRRITAWCTFVDGNIVLAPRVYQMDLVTKQTVDKWRFHYKVLLPYFEGPVVQGKPLVLVAGEFAPDLRHVRGIVREFETPTC